MTHLLLGFDILAIPEIANWDQRDAKERELFLLRPEVKWPISVDRLICPSVFQPELMQSGGVELVLTRFSKSLDSIRTVTDRTIDWSESDLNILGLWTDMSSMLRWLNERPELHKLIRFPIAVRVLLNAPTTSDPLWQTVLESGTNPPAVAQDWRCLGYDVADRGQISALSDCQYQEDEMEQARRRWSTHVNESGLLGDIESARALKGFSDIRVPEHAPFYVYEIFRLDSKPENTKV